jgi:hypothetical protein
VPREGLVAVSAEAKDVPPPSRRWPEAVSLMISVASHSK